MAFKMKGSAFKLGNVATKSAMKTKITDHPSEMGKAHNKAHDPGGTFETNPEKHTPHNYKSAFKQTDDDLRDWLLDEKGFSQEEVDQMITTGAYDLDNSEFVEWYATSGKSDDSSAPVSDASIPR